MESTKILSAIFGQQATGLAAGQLPMWYYEGDAVCTETALGKFGRGRSPSFEKNIKTHLLSDEKRFTLDQFLFGSYKSNIPDHYEFGYQVTAYLRTNYDENIWSLVHNHVAKNSYTLAPTPLAFSWGLKKYAGVNQKQLFNEAMNYADSIYTVSELNYNAIQSPLFQLYRIKDYEDYLNPVFADNQKVIVLKKGLGHLPRFVFVTPEKETPIHEPGVLISDDFSFAKNFIVWAEYKPHFRWQNKEYTTIKMFNTETKRERIVIDKSRYFSPDISADANKIAVIEVTSNNNYFLTIISSYKGDVIETIPSNNFIQRPKWSPDQKFIYVIELSEQGKQISRYNMENKNWEILFDVFGADIQRVIPQNDYVFFNSTQNGRDEIYLFDQMTSAKYQISQSSSGIVDFCIDTNNKTIIAAEHTSQGNRLVKIPIERGLWRKTSDKIQTQGAFSEQLSSQEGFNSEKIDIPNEEYTIKSYSKLLNLFNFHSWVPFYFDYNQNSVNGFLSDPTQVFNQVYPGIMLLSQNKLSTAESILSYAYKNGHHYLQTSFIYKGFLPIISFTANYGDLHQYFAPQDTYWNPILNYDDFSYNLTLYLPINFSTGKMYGGFMPRINIDYRNTFYYNYQKDYYVKGNEFVTSELFFYWLKRRSHRDIQSPAGVILDFKLHNTPFEKELFGYMSNIEGTFYLPGFYLNHGFKINVGYQFQNPQLYLYNSYFDFPHGIEKFRTDEFTKIYADYVFPIVYPDLSLGPIAYIKRLKGDLYFNYAYNKFRAYDQETNSVYWAKYSLLSYGLEISVDYHLFRMIFPLNTGVRVGYTNLFDQVFYEAVFGIDISGY